MDGLIAYALSKKYADEVGRSIVDAGFKTQVEQDRSILQTAGQEKILYFIPKMVASPSDGYDEYVYSNNAWEQVGATDVDLSSIASGVVNQNGTITFFDENGDPIFTTTGESVIGPKGDTGAAGADGYSPTVSTTNLDAQTLVTVTDKNGAHNFYVKDGSSVTNAAVDENGDLIISIQQKPTSGVNPIIYTLEVNAGHVVGAAGAKGDKGDKGDTGNDYVLTAQDKADIANIVLQELPTTQGVLYGNSSD